jgi:hypothetical protein
LQQKYEKNRVLEPTNAGFPNANLQLILTTAAENQQGGLGIWGYV